MLEIKFDVTTLNNEERQDLASFILGWPERIEHATLHNEQASDIKGSSVIARQLGDAKRIINNNPFTPEASPLPEGASAAPMSAGAEVSSIAPEVIPETTSINPIANIPPVPQSANAVAPAVPPQANPVELDSEGLPWDGRIHSSSHAKIANGAWKLIRGSDPAIVDAVKSELRALMAAPAIVVPKIPTPPAPPIVSEIIAATPPAPASHYLLTPIRHGFVDFIEDITKMLVSKKLAQPEIIKVCNDAGVAAPNLLAARQDLIPQVAKALDTIVASRI